MPFIRCFVDERTMQVLERVAITKGCAPHEIAEQELESYAVSQVSGGLLGMHWSDSARFNPQDRRDETNGFPFGTG